MTWGEAFDGTQHNASTPGSKPIDHSEWELAFDGDRAHNTLLRMRVPGGWLYRMEGSKELTYVPDA